MFGTIIKDLHGNIFSVKSWRLYIAIPLKDIKAMIYTRDRISDKVFDLAITHEDKYFAFCPIQEQSLYTGYELTLKGYDESLDIRKAYLYGRKNK